MRHPPPPVTQWRSSRCTRAHNTQVDARAGCERRPSTHQTVAVVDPPLRETPTTKHRWGNDECDDDDEKVAVVVDEEEVSSLLSPSLSQDSPAGRR